MRRSAAKKSRLALVCGIALATLQLLGGCGQTVDVGVDDPLGVGGSAAAGDAAAAGSLDFGGGSGVPTAFAGAAEGGAAGCTQVRCRGKLYACGDCSDNDGDGKIDSADPDCLGPCDDDEKNLSTGLNLGPSQACRQDCYFDGDSGQGNDKCQWSQQCDPLSVAPDYPPSGDARCAYDPKPMGLDCSELSTSQDPACIDTCLPLVPNGCDCFGCCELPAGSGEFHYLGGVKGSAGCELDANGDPSACPPCTPTKDSCFNDCAKCENCVGRGPDPSCEPGSACPAGHRACGPDAPCDFGDYCVTGCCVRSPPA